MWVGRETSIIAGAAAAIALLIAVQGCSSMPGAYSDGGAHRRGIATESSAVVPESAPTATAKSDIEPVADKSGVPESVAGADAPEGRAAAAMPQEAIAAGLIIEDQRVGGGAVCDSASLVVVRYQAQVQGGELFDQTGEGESRGPWPVQSLVAGLRAGLVGMREGGRRRLEIPPSLGYGDTPVLDAATGEALIPAGATLEFTVELVEVVGGADGEQGDVEG